MSHSTNRHSFLRTLAAAGACLCAATFLTAGPLNPPAGAVGSTGKALSDVEPRIAVNATNTPGGASSVYTINAPGSYYLTGNVASLPSKGGIMITASNVTLDLNGFTVAGSTSTGNGIWIQVTGQSSVTVKNGTISGWSNAGIDFATNLAPNCRVSDVIVHNCAGQGITVGTASVLSGCTVGSNGAIGIATSSGCTITNCISSSNGAQGYLLGSGSTITGCTSYLNTGNGIDTANGCTVANCTSYANTTHGIRVLVGCTVLNNTCKSNGFGAGTGADIFIGGENNRIEGNTCTSADVGIQAGSVNNLIIRNSCSGNTTNWIIAANNVYGTIVDRTAPASAAVNGNSAAGTVGTTDPNANITY